MPAASAAAASAFFFLSASLILTCGAETAAAKEKSQRGQIVGARKESTGWGETGLRNWRPRLAEEENASESDGGTDGVRHADGVLEENDGGNDDDLGEQSGEK